MIEKNVSNKVYKKALKTQYRVFIQNYSNSAHLEYSLSRSPYSVSLLGLVTW